MLKIRVVSHCGRAPANPREIYLNEAGGTLGRLETNQVVLPDPERHISRVHARIVHRSGGYFILHQGSNPILLNGARLNIGDHAPLNDGDELAVSTYRLRVSIADGKPGDDEARVQAHHPSPDQAQPARTVLRTEKVSASHDGICGLANEPLPEPHEISVHAVDVDLEALDAQAGEALRMPDTGAELFCSWKTDMALYRVPQSQPVPRSDVASLPPALVAMADRAVASSASHGGDPSASAGTEDAAVETPAKAQGSRSAAQSHRKVGHRFDGADARAALDYALRRFSPEHLEQRLKHRTMLDSMLSMTRKAKLWDLFCSAYGEIAQEVRDDLYRVLAEELTRLRAQAAHARGQQEGIGS